MKRKFSIYHFLVALMLSTLLLPAFAGATEKREEVGSLTIHKFEQEKNTERAKGDGSIVEGLAGKPLAGVEYTLKQTHHYDPTTDEWTETDGSSKTYTTNSDGKIEIDNIDLGRYEVQETAWPDHVDGNDTVYTVDIPMTNPDRASFNYDVHIYPKNDTIRGGAILTKFANDTNKTLDGVKFKVYDENDEVVTDEDDKEIVLVSSKGTVEVDGLAYGNYYFKEIETVDGFLLNGEKVHFEVSEQDEVVNVELQNYSKPEVEKDVDKKAVNRGEEVTFTISVTLPKDINNYERFVITDQLDDRLVFVEDSQSTTAGFEFAEEDGTLTWTAKEFEELTPGTLKLTFKAQVKEDALPNETIPNVGEIDYDNSYVTDQGKTPEVEVTPTVGSLTVHKVDGVSGKGLSGAEFELRDVNGKVVAIGTSGDDGKVDFNGATDELDYGHYTLEETKAPADYTLLRNPIDVTINDKESHDVELKVKNFKSGWELPQTGGIGTMLFTFLGLSLMGGASFMFVRRRQSEEA